MAVKSNSRRNAYLDKEIADDVRNILIDNPTGNTEFLSKKVVDKIPSLSLPQARRAIGIAKVELANFYRKATEHIKRLEAEKQKAILNRQDLEEDLTKISEKYQGLSIELNNEKNRSRSLEKEISVLEQKCAEKSEPRLYLPSNDDRKEQVNLKTEVSNFKNRCEVYHGVNVNVTIVNMIED